MSLSVWREWVEIDKINMSELMQKSLSVWREWVEISYCGKLRGMSESLSVWREWVEIDEVFVKRHDIHVSLRVERVG